MKILHTVEFYYPSVGGAQEVVRQISERLVQRGHEVTVATTRLPERRALDVNGVRIEEFEISGNAVNGFEGEVDRYQRFLLDSKFDIMMNYAAQEWTMDLAFPLLRSLTYRKVMTPCGFSALYNSLFGDYFAHMPNVMRQYDHLVFHANDYRDIDFTRQHGLVNYSVIPNGAAAEEFDSPAGDFRERYGIDTNSPMLLTIGNHTGEKGHRLAIETLRRLSVDHASLVIIGGLSERSNLWFGVGLPLTKAMKRLRVYDAARILLNAALGGASRGCLPECRTQAKLVNLHRAGKQIFLLDPPRQDVVAAYQAADLFLFGSNVEYSPLVLFEAMAAGLPFVTTACGNASEIIAWSGGGVLVPSNRREDGTVHASPADFSLAVESLLSDSDRRARLGRSGREAWRSRFTWDAIAQKYEKLYTSLVNP